MARLEEQVLSIEQMRHLQKLGLEVKDTAMCWNYDTLRMNPQWVVNVNHQNVSTKYHIPTLLMSEIWNMIPKIITKDSVRYKLLMEYGNVGYFSWKGLECDSILEGFQQSDYDESDMGLLYQMLCWCAQNGFLNASKSMPLNKE